VNKHEYLLPKIMKLKAVKYYYKCLTLRDLSVLDGRFLEMAASEAWSRSRIDLLTLSMASSHSFCPGALSLLH
jgi:hypothetical protein